MTDLDWMHLALRLARRGYGHTSPNPMVGAVVVVGGLLTSTLLTLFVLPVLYRFFAARAAEVEI